MAISSCTMSLQAYGMRTCDTLLVLQPWHLKDMVLRSAMAMRPQLSQTCTR